MDLEQRRLVAGRYRLLSPLGVGGMGTVWRARDELLGREVAVKEVTFPHGLSDADRDVLRERTRREARAAARLDHPSAVTVYDVVEEHGAPYLVMELVEARTLAEVVRTEGPLSPQRAARVGLALLGALETAHRQGIVHRDVKPGNVLLGAAPGGKDAGSEGRVVLTDFGIASSAGDASITSTGLLLGSPAYIAPERARGKAPGPASDLWSLGATLFTAVEGRPPYDGGDPLTTVTAVVTGEHEPFLSAGPLEPVIEGLLERDPDRRLTAQGARELLLPVAASGAGAGAASGAGVGPVAEPRLEPVTERPAERTTALPLPDLPDGARARPPRASGPPPAPLPAAPARRRPPPTVLREPPRTGRSWAPLALVTALVLLGGGGAGYLLSQAPADPVTEPSTAPTAPVAPSPSPEPAAALPEGWTRYEDPQEGWSVGVPPGYEVSDRDGQVQFRDDEQRRTLRISARPPAGEPLATAEAFSQALEGALQDYEQLRLEAAEHRGQPAADLEFTYFDETDLRVLDRRFVEPSGEQAYELYWQTNASDWDDARPVFDQILETFAPRP